jgi:hypothetical protein
LPLAFFSLAVKAGQLVPALRTLAAYAERLEQEHAMRSVAIKEYAMAGSIPAGAF